MPLIKNEKIFSIVCIVLAVTAALLAVIILIFSGENGEKQIKVGCVFSGSIDETGWTKNNYDGLSEVCKKYGALLYIREKVSEDPGDCKEAVKYLVNAGCGIIFLTSYGYADIANEMVKQYPNVAFFANGSHQHADNMTYYFGRMYQGRYLAGITAGMKTKTNIIGYVAAMENAEVLRGIDAFTLGVRSVNPNAQVRIRYTNSWDSKNDEEAAVKLLVSEGADVLTYHQNQEYVPKAADAAGVDFISYHEISGEYSEHHLTGVRCDWKVVYDQILNDYRRGIVDFSDEYWLGFAENAMSLAPYSPLVSSDIRQRVEEEMFRIINGRSVFSGLIYDSEGNIRCYEDERMSDDTILNGIDWYVEGAVAE